MQAFGARITDAPSDKQQITETLIRTMIHTAAEISRRPGHWYCDQLNNHDATQGYLPLGEEIWRQTRGEVAPFVHSVSTAHSIHGVTQALWRRDPGRAQSGSGCERGHHHLRLGAALPEYGRLCAPA